MTRLTLIIIIFCLFICLAFPMESVGNGKNSTNNAFSGFLSRIVEDTPTFIEAVFHQKLNHKESAINSEKWRQKYFWCDTFFQKNKGPVVLVVGGNAPIKITFLQSKSIIMEWVKLLKAICFMIEHRYYGSSHPTSDASTKNLMNYLNVGQALGDLAYFIESVKIMTKWSLSDKNKWIVIGGSYAGSLAAWMQRKYPHLVDVAVASSAMMFPIVNFKEFHVAVGNAVQKYNQKHKNHNGLPCYVNIQEAFSTIESWIGMGENDVNARSCEELTEKFNVDPDLDCNDHLQVSFFFEQLASRVGSYVLKNDIETLCDFMTKPGKENIDNLADAIATTLLNQKTGKYKKLNIDYEGYIELNQNPSFEIIGKKRTRQYSFQQCTELGGFQTSDSGNQPFGSYFDIKFMISYLCTDIFGSLFELRSITKSVEEKFYTKYTPITNYQKTIFTVGEFDPFFATQMKKENTNKNKVVMIKGAGHCNDLQSSSSKDSNELIKARGKILKFIKKYI